jgi:phosphinothricin acetyltransferase
MSLTIRNAKPKDIPQINAIYNYAIGLGYSTAHSEPMSLSYHENWFRTHKEEDNPILVAMDGDNVLGWNALSYYRSGRQGLSGVRETSYYIHRDHWNRGIASALMERTIEMARMLPVHTLVSFIIDANHISVHLMEKFGFELWGRLPGVLVMSTGRFDHLIFGKRLI